MSQQFWRALSEPTWESMIMVISFYHNLWCERWILIKISMHWKTRIFLLSIVLFLNFAHYFKSAVTFCAKNRILPQFLKVYVIAFIMMLLWNTIWLVVFKCSNNIKNGCENPYYYFQNNISCLKCKIILNKVTKYSHTVAF